MDLSPFKEALLRKRGEILSAGGGVKPLQASTEINTRQGDLADQASGNNEVHIQLKLKQTDAKILQAIEEALYRMEKGTYGDLPRLRRADRAGAPERDSLDPRLHHLQGKAELVKATELLELLARVLPRQAGDAAAPRRGRAATSADYDFNNTYQYVIAREDMHVRWLRDAITDLGGAPEERAGAATIDAAGKGAEAQRRRCIAADRDAAQRVRRQVAAARRRAAQRPPPQPAAASSSARRSSTSASSTRRSPAATTCSAAAPTAPAPAAASCRRGGWRSEQSRSASDFRVDSDRGHRTRRAARSRSRSAATSATAAPPSRSPPSRLVARSSPTLTPSPTSIETEPDGRGPRGSAALPERRRRRRDDARPPRELLDALLAIEQDFGRERPFPAPPRTLDLDLILLGDARGRGAGPAGAASALPRALLRARAAGRGRAGPARSGDRAEGGGAAAAAAAETRAR